MVNLHTNDQVNLLTTSVTNIFKNFVPSKTIVCKHKDPPWMTDEIKRVCMDKAKVYRQYVKMVTLLMTKSIYKTFPLTVLVL